MTLNILFAARPERWKIYEAPLRAALADAGIDAHLATDIAPDQVDYIVKKCTLVGHSSSSRSVLRSFASPRIVLRSYIA